MQRSLASSDDLESAMVNVAHDGVPAARAIMQFRRRHDG